MALISPFSGGLRTAGGLRVCTCVDWAKSRTVGCTTTLQASSVGEKVPVCHCLEEYSLPCWLHVSLTYLFSSALQKKHSLPGGGDRSVYTGTTPAAAVGWPP